MVIIIIIVIISITNYHYQQSSSIITTQKRSNVPVFIVIQWPTEAFRCGMAATTTSWARAPLKPLKWIVPTNVTPELKPGKYFFLRECFNLNCISISQAGAPKRRKITLKIYGAFSSKAQIYVGIYIYIDWLTVWLIGCLIDCFVDLVDWFDWLIWLIDLIDWLIDWFDWLIWFDLLIDWLRAGTEEVSDETALKKCTMKHVCMIAACSAFTSFMMHEPHLVKTHTKESSKRVGQLL